MHTESALCLHLLHHHVQEDKGPRAAHPRTAVHQQWLVQGDGVLLTHTTDKPDEGHDILRHPVVRPASVVELGDYHVPRVFFHELCIYVHRQRQDESTITELVSATDVFQFEFPDLVLGKWQSGGVGHTELVSWSDAVMQLLGPVLDTLGLHIIMCMYIALMHC